MCQSSVEFSIGYVLVLLNLNKKEGKTIETNTYIMTFNTSKIPAKIKVGYAMERVKQFVPSPLR